MSGKTHTSFRPSMTGVMRSLPENRYAREEPLDAVLNYLTSGMFACILEEVIATMRLLFGSNNALAISKIMIEMEMHLKKKYGVNMPPVDELDLLSSYSIGCDEIKLFKLDKDRTFFADVMCATYKDIVLRRNYKSLINEIQNIIQRKKDFAALQAEFNKNGLLIKELRRSLRQTRVHATSTIYDASVMLDNLQRSIADAELTLEIKVRYLENWERARVEQHVVTIKNTDDEYGHSIQYYRNRSETEATVHNEINELVNDVINDTKNKIQSWMEKYEKDTETIGLKIQVQRNLYLSMLGRRMELEEQIQSHKNQMFEWTEFKRKRAEAIKYFNDMTRCAIMIQAWWRGLLVRRELGPFRVAKRKKSKKK